MKRIIILAVLFLLTITVCGACVAQPFVLGDVNNDGVIDDSDYSDVRLSILGLLELSPEQFRAADMNKDGAVSVSDYTMIRLLIIGNAGGE